MRKLQIVPSETVPDPDDRPRHLIALDVDQVQEVSGMVMPSRVITKESFI